MKGRSVCVPLLLVTALLWAAPRLHAQDGLPGAFSQGVLVSPFGLPLAIADFDNDHKPDGAVLLDSTRVRDQNSFIELHFSDRRNTSLSFEATGTAQSILALDIDHDGDVDIVVDEPFSHRILQVWLNDGHGNFEQGRVDDASAAVTSRERLQQFRSCEPPLPLGLLPQRTTESATLVARRLAARPPSTAALEALPIAFLAASPEFDPQSSRAPPQLSL
jgi:hypothetical protein